MESKIKAKTWIVFVLIGLFGQLAWSVENMYLNVFLYNTIIQSTSYIAAMVAASAVTATLTAFIMGAVADKSGKRKAFISVGYILWGISTGAFGFINNSIIKSASLAAMMVVILDCIMTFFGSTANDAAFNAYVTENTDESNRGKVEGVLSTFPLLSMLIIFGLFDPLTQRGEWKSFFLIFGGANIVAGIAALFLVSDEKAVKKEEDVIKGILKLFTISEIKTHRERYLTLVTFGCFNIALQVYLPYLIIYIQHYLGFNNYALMLAVVLVGASLASIIAGRIIDKIGKSQMCLIAGFIMLVGLISVYLTRSYISVMIAALIMMSGYMITFSSLGAKIRDITPKHLTGSFQGIRMIFQVALPMIIGPMIGNAVIKGSGTYTELGEVKNIPTPNIFLASAIVLLITAIFVFMLIKEENKNGISSTTRA